MTAIACRYPDAPRPVSPNPGEAGLTLLELIVALSLVALTGLILSGNVALGSRVWETSQTTLAEGRQRDAVIRRIVSLVSAARPPGPVAGGGFTGDAGSIRFRTRPPTALARGENRDLVLQFTRNKQLLTLTILPNRRQTAKSDPEKITPMLDNVEDFRIRYQGLDPGGAIRRWSSLWNGRTTMPELVEFTLTRGGKTTIFSAAPRIRGTVGCLLRRGPECPPAGKPEP